eukprot:comp20718_c2_seq1/m.27056 comp20718_c2_seq1/g.27056  ORF comp20718_c2_seq1/g.27056 comp20718_c2_seq1/m.27056 type:complete len:643 (-) comp20718_c2_seq1:29-1957(-)
MARKMSLNVRLALVVTTAATVGIKVTEAQATAKLWQEYAEAYTKKLQLPIPDYSWAGYKYSQTPIPKVTTTIFDVTNYGAVRDGSKYVDRQVQDAIDAAQEKGGGVVYFPAGTYKFGPVENSPPLKKDHVLRISASNIVLRGAGSGTGGTTLFLDRKQIQMPLINIKAPSGGGSSSIAIIKGDVLRESFTIKVNSITDLKPKTCFRIRYGDTKNPNKGMAYLESWFGNLTLPAAWTNLRTNGIRVYEPHCVASVNAATKTVTMTEPAHLELLVHDQPFEIWKYRPIQNIGIENMRLKGNWASIAKPFCHHCSDTDDAGWTALIAEYVRDFWIHDVVLQDWNQGIKFNQCSAGTVKNVRFTGKKGHFSIESRRSYGILIADCVDEAGTQHGPSTQAYDEGTVYLRHVMQPGQGIDMHAALPSYTLLDNITGGVVAGCGGSTGDFPNHGRGLTLWNFKHRDPIGAPKRVYQFWSTDTEKTSREDGSVFYKPIVIGLHSGQGQFTLNTSTVERSESIGAPVQPASLFEAQLCLRLGQSACKSGLQVPDTPTDTDGGSTDTATRPEGMDGPTNTGPTAGAIAGAVIGSIAAVAVIAVLAVVAVRRKVPERVKSHLLKTKAKMAESQVGFTRKGASSTSGAIPGIMV